MTCKNCSNKLKNDQLFCDNCGSKVIRKRITVKNLVSDLSSNLFGWDNKFFLTLRMLILKPDVLLEEYIEGARKKYMNPFTLLGLGAAIALFVFNFFSEDYLALNIESNAQTLDVIVNMKQKQMGEDFDVVAFKQEQLEIITNYSSFVLKYFNFFVILFIPFYTLLSFLTYRKPYNYGEHLVINSFIQGLSFLVTSIIFTISVFTNPSVYIITIVLLIIYYTYAYGKLHKLSVPESILKLFKFFGILIISIIALMILGILIGFIAALISNIFYK